MTKYTPAFLLYQIIFILFAFGGNYARYDSTGVEIPWEVRRETHLDVAHHWLQGTTDEIEFPPVFTFADANWSDQSAEAGFVDGCLYPILKQAMPSAMEFVIEGVESYPTAVRDKIIMWMYTAGFFDGDGSTSGSVSFLWYQAIPFIQLKIKGKSIPYKAFLGRHAGFTTDERTAEKSFKDMDFIWLLAFSTCLTIKRIQFFVLMLLSLPLRVLGTVLTPVTWFTRRIYGIILSALNVAHGNGISQKCYEEHFEDLRTSIHKLQFVLHLAGMIGADGGVGYGRTAGLTCIFQSNPAYICGLANAVQRAVPTVGVRETNSSRAKDCYTLNFSVKQAETIMVAVGSLDYNRRAQHLLSIISRMVVNAPENIPNKCNIQDFLEDILKVIRKEEQS